MLMSCLKDIQIITQYLDCIYITLIYGVKMQQFKIDCKLLQHFYRDSIR